MATSEEAIGVGTLTGTIEQVNAIAGRLSFILGPAGQYAAGAGLRANIDLTGHGGVPFRSIICALQRPLVFRVGQRQNVNDGLEWQDQAERTAVEQRHWRDRRSRTASFRRSGGPSRPNSGTRIARRVERSSSPRPRHGGPVASRQSTPRSRPSTTRTMSRSTSASASSARGGRRTPRLTRGWCCGRTYSTRPHGPGRCGRMCKQVHQQMKEELALDHFAGRPGAACAITLW